MKVNGYKIKPFANLPWADLHSAKLPQTDLRAVDFSCTNAIMTDFSGSDLTKADLYLSNLGSSDLRGSRLKGVCFTGANLFNAKLDDSEKHRLGEKLKQDIVGYKKCYVNTNPFRVDYAIVELIIPRGAIVFSINSTKCRTDKAKVKAIYDMHGHPLKRAYSMFNLQSYYVGDEFEIFDFNCQYNVECAEGIHFFRTLEEAKNYHH